jgi:hypothetical protein
MYIHSLYIYSLYGTYLVDALRPSSAPLTVLIWSHSTRQSFVESALASPPILRSYIYFPSSACIYPAGVSLPSRINRKRKSPISMESGGRFASVCQSKNQTLENYSDPIIKGLHGCNAPQSFHRSLLHDYYNTTKTRSK